MCQPRAHAELTHSSCGCVWRLVSSVGHDTALGQVVPEIFSVLILNIFCLAILLPDVGVQVVGAHHLQQDVECHRGSLGVEQRDANVVQNLNILGLNLKYFFGLEQRYADVVQNLTLGHPTGGGRG